MEVSHHERLVRTRDSALDCALKLMILVCICSFCFVCPRLGYMINWIAGHNSGQKFPFKALVCHDGMFDTRAFYYSTDELWFPEHDMKGVPWVQPQNFEQWNPASPELVAKWSTPMMVIHVSRAQREKHMRRISREAL